MTRPAFYALCLVWCVACWAFLIWAVATVLAVIS